MSRELSNLSGSPIRLALCLPFYELLRVFIVRLTKFISAGESTSIAKELSECLVFSLL
jgi:hypothetical protein